MRKSILILLALTSCLKTEVLNTPKEKVDSVAVYYKPRPPRPPRDTTEVEDTTRIPISFDVSVDDWDEIDVDL